MPTVAPCGISAKLLWILDTNASAHLLWARMCPKLDRRAAERAYLSLSALQYQYSLVAVLPQFFGKKSFPTNLF